MLNKDICKKCRLNGKHNWGDSGERLWNKLGVVFCEVLRGKNTNTPLSSIKDPPPSGCPYALAHAIAAGRSC